jgi:hypothetical protein
MSRDREGAVYGFFPNSRPAIRRYSEGEIMTQYLVAIYHPNRPATGKQREVAALQPV